LYYLNNQLIMQPIQNDMFNNSTQTTNLHQGSLVAILISSISNN
jgi:hypothetical protein